MKPFSQIWANAQEIAQGAMRRADADINGTERAKTRYEQLAPAERIALEKTVVERYGAAAWDDYMKAIGGGNGGQGTKSA